MKAVLFSLCALLALSACNKEETVPLSGTPQTSTSQHLDAALRVTDGLRISELVEEGTNETSAFRSYLFRFSSDGSVTASDTEGTINGTYTVFRDDGRTELRMDFPTNSDFDELSDDWYFISQDEQSIHFEDGGDRLVFQKQRV